MKEFRRNNAGLSLVEIMVSVAILAIIVLPLLSSFVTSARTNAKAKNKLRATNVAENVMEGMETLSVKEFAYQFNYPQEGFDAFMLSDDSTVMQVIPAGDSYGEVTKREDIASEITNPEDLISSAILKNLSGNGYKFLESDSRKYYFFASNLKVDNRKYNAFITLDAKTNDLTSINRVYNTQSLADMSKMDTNYDAINSIKHTTSDILSEIDSWGYHTRNHGDGKQILGQNDISRTISIDITKSVSDATIVRITYQYEFNYEGHHIKFPLEGAANENDYTSVIYDNTYNTSCNLREIYLFYQPWYTSNSNNGHYGCTDKIVINNNESIPCEVSIIKQNCVDPNLLEQYENNYNVFVELSELSNGTSHAVTKIATNLDTNLGNVNSAIQPRQAYYMYNNNVNESSLANIMTVTGLEAAKAEDRLYDVRVDVYSNKTSLSDINSTDPIVSFTGSMVE